MVSFPSGEWLTRIFVSYLEGNTPGFLVGWGEAPESAGFPYLVVTPLSPFLITGPLGDSNADHVAEWQVTSVALTTQQAQGGIDAANDQILGTVGPDFTPAGYTVSGSWRLVPGPAFSADMGDKPPLFHAIVTYRAFVTPV